MGGQTFSTNHARNFPADNSNKRGALARTIIGLQTDNSKKRPPRPQPAGGCTGVAGAICTSGFPPAGAVARIGPDRLTRLSGGVKTNVSSRE
jgi:hypothetical protein